MGDNMSFWKSNNGAAAQLTPPGIGGGVTQAQLGMFAQAAQQSGLTDMAVNQVDQMTNGMGNEDQAQLIYHLMATHPNEVALFFLHYPNFMKEFAGLIALIVRREIYQFFASGAVNTQINAEKAVNYSSITEENIDSQVAKVVPIQELQAEVNDADMRAMNLMNQHDQGMMQANMQQQMNQQQQQQQVYQQQMYQQQMQPQRQGISGALGSFGSNLIRGTLNLPPAQQQVPQQMMQPGMQMGMQP